jgi:bifunctional non-homologous end joining protein LigD
MPRSATRRPASLPQWVAPQLTQLVDFAPEGDEWLHELKYDGYRMHALGHGAVKLVTRQRYAHLRETTGSHAMDNKHL